MVFEKMDEDLYTAINVVRFVSESQTSPVIDQILEGVRFLHSHNILHRDLKVDNILCKKFKGGKFRIAIADFGFAVCATEPVTESLGKFFAGLLA